MTHAFDEFFFQIRNERIFDYNERIGANPNPNKMNTAKTYLLFLLTVLIILFYYHFYILNYSNTSRKYVGYEQSNIEQR